MTKFKINTGLDQSSWVLLGFLILVSMVAYGWKGLFWMLVGLLILALVIRGKGRRVKK